MCNLVNGNSLTTACLATYSFVHTDNQKPGELKVTQAFIGSSIPR